MRTEDHPVDYGSFEGVIPEGEYGGGTVLLWDRGTWEPVGDPRKGLAKGKLEFVLHGKKLRGRWTLVQDPRPRAPGRRQGMAAHQGTGRDRTAIGGLRHHRGAPGERRDRPRARRRSPASVTACGIRTRRRRQRPHAAACRPTAGASAWRPPRCPAPVARALPIVHRAPARHPGRRAARGRRLAARDEVRRLSRAVPDRAWRGAAAEPQRQGLDRAPAGRRAGGGAAPVRDAMLDGEVAVRAAERGHQLQRPPERARRRVRRRAGLLRLRSAAPRRQRPHRAARSRSARRCCTRCSTAPARTRRCATAITSPATVRRFSATPAACRSRASSRSGATRPTCPVAGAAG